MFLNCAGPGCRLHAYCLDQGIDYHELKSLVDCLFPLTFAEDRLCLSDGQLVCANQGPTAYEGNFGDACVASLVANQAVTGRRL